MANPSDFYVGVLDLFGVLLPGAVATALLEPRLGDYIFDSVVTRPDGGAGWVAFALVSYFLGHLIFLVGSWLDPWYNHLRKRYDPNDNRSAYQAATKIRDTLLSEEERVPLNTFQWSRSVLLAKCPAAAQDVHRLEADSKFFRSILVVALLAAVVFATELRFVESAMAAVLVVPCFVRYYERRLKSTTQAYIHVVTLYRVNGLGQKAASGV